MGSPTNAAPFSLGNRSLGQGYPCFLIAEAGVNHNGNPEMAISLVDAAAKAGVCSVKFQTFHAERMCSPTAPKARYQKASGLPSESQLEMIRRLELSEETHRALIRRCGERGILFLSSPFDEASADLLCRLGVAALKIPSGELTNLPFLDHVASLGQPVILSTGMASLDEVEEALERLSALRTAGIALLHCVSAYPADPGDVNLRAMYTLRERFGLPVGLSDHTEGIEIPLAAAALGACIIEKHFTLDRTLPGPDHRASLEPPAMAALATGVRKIEAALGNGVKRPAASEQETAAVARKSIIAAVDIPKGVVIRDDMLLIARPGTGLAPARIREVVGRSTVRPIPSGTLLSEEDFQ